MSGTSHQEAARVLEVVPEVMAVIRGEMRRNRCCDVTVPQYRTLAFLNRYPGASLSDVAEHIGLTPPAMSRLVDGLVVRGLVTRAIPAGNRRRIVLELTAPGRAALAAALGPTESYLAEQLGTLSDEERAVIARAMNLLESIFTGERGAASQLVTRSNGNVGSALGGPTIFEQE